MDGSLDHSDWRDSAGGERDGSEEYGEVVPALETFGQRLRTLGHPITLGGSVKSECSLLSGVQLFATPLTVARQAPLSMEFSRQEYWSGLLCRPPGELPDPGIEPMSPTSPALPGRFLTTRATWEALTVRGAMVLGLEAKFV